MHVAIGLALTPVVLLKAGSTGWRLVKDYRGDRAYIRRGAPPADLRILGPVVIAGTVVLLARSRARLAGVRARRYVLAAVLVAGAVLAVVLAGDYLHLYPPYYLLAGR